MDWRPGAEHIDGVDVDDGFGFGDADEERRRLREDSDEFYVLLNVPKTATTDQIRDRYKHLAMLLHPDKHPPEHREAAAARFRAVQHAYEVLSDDSKRMIYDTLGARALDTEWAVGQRLKTPQELRAEFQRLSRAQRVQEMDAMVNVHTSINCTLDATGLFERSIRRASEDVEDARLLEQLAEIPEDTQQQSDLSQGEDSIEKLVEAALDDKEEPASLFELQPSDALPDLSPQSNLEGTDDSVIPELEEFTGDEDDEAEKEEEEELEDEELEDEELEEDELEGEEPEEGYPANAMERRPLISFSRLMLSHSSDIPISQSIRGNLSASAVSRAAGRGSGNLKGTVRWQFSNRASLTAGSNLIKSQVPFVEVDSTLPYLKDTSLTVHTHLPTVFMPPPVTGTVTRQLTPGWLGQVGVATGTWALPFWPKFDLDVYLVPLKDNGTPTVDTVYFSEKALLDEDPEAVKLDIPRAALAATLLGIAYEPAHVTLSVASTPVPDRPSRLKTSFGLNIRQDLACYLSSEVSGPINLGLFTRWGLDLLEKREQEGSEQEDRERDRRRGEVWWKLALSVGIDTGLGVSGWLSGRAGQVGWGLGVDFGMGGVMLRIRLTRLGQRIVLPVLLSREVDALLAVCTAGMVGASAVGCICAGEIYYEQSRKRRRKERNVGYTARQRKEAAEVRDMLQDQVRRNVATERASDGLVILEAVYAPTETLTGARVLSEAESSDVTIPVQALVNNSHLFIPGGRSKAGLLGFYDVFQGPKSLRVRYEFRGAEHEVIVSDTEPLAVPRESHLTTRTT